MKDDSLTCLINSLNETQETIRAYDVKAEILALVVTLTHRAHRLGYEFEWQTRFYDHIIRNENDYFRISNYIKNNPHNWDNDKLNNGIGNTVMEPTAQYGDEKWMV